MKLKIIFLEKKIANVFQILIFLEEVLISVAQFIVGKCVGCDVIL